MPLVTPPEPSASPERAEAYYQRFSSERGLGDWVRPNRRHEQLKLLVRDLIRGQSNLRILDVGCGAGVLSDYLARYGRVTGTDFSRPAIEVAQTLARAHEFHAGRLEELDLEGPFDLITLFDVIEHVPREDWGSLLSELRAKLDAEGRLVISSPHPNHTRWLRHARPELLQVIDEQVEPLDLMELARGLELDLVHYTTFDIASRRQYQLFVLEPLADPEATPLFDPRLRRRLRVLASLIGQGVRRGRLAARALLAGKPRLAGWLLVPRGRPPVSSVTSR